MITCSAFTWYHLPRSGGTATAHWWRRVVSMHGLEMMIDPDHLAAKHDNHATRRIRDQSFKTGGRISLMNFRRLPAWLESNYRFARAQGLDVPAERYIGGEFFSLRMGQWCPADWWLDYFKANRMDRLLPVERLEDALRGLLLSEFGLTVPDDLTLHRLNSKDANTPLAEPWTDCDWSAAFQKNPVWATIERQLYDETDARHGGQDASPPNEPSGEAIMTAQRALRRPEPVASTADPIVGLLSEGHFTKALALAMRRMQDEGESLQGHIQIANIEMLLGFQPRAQRSWRRALQLEDVAEARLGLGICLFQAGQLGEALGQFRQGLALDEDSLPLLTSASIASTMLGDFAAAARFAARALVIDPDNPEAMLCSTRAEQALGNLSRVRRLIRQLDHQGYKPDEVALLKVALHSADDDHATALATAAELCEAHPASQSSLAAFRTAFRTFKTNAASYEFEELAESLLHPPAQDCVLSRPAMPAGSSSPVDVIVPVHNALEVTLRAIKAVLDHASPSLGRLILVDDGSNADTAKALSKVAAMYPQVVLVACPVRQGFTNAIREGLKHSDSAAFLALNSDTIVTGGWLEKMNAGLHAAADIAMIGPLSNNAAWQNYGPVFDETGEYRSDPIPDDEAQAEVVAHIEALGSGRLAETAMVHGFCALVDRKKYEAVGGLDETAFPEGYGEFQDLSYRLRANGNRLFVTLDTVVFHEQGASLAPVVRAALSLSGRKMLYERYSAFNYLFVEAACAEHRDTGALRKALGRRLVRSTVSG
ncbi:MAG: glycosyltransferase [Tabrizicola sp.]|nr:glycosyltransferase [Tabrizicola sp.]